MPAPKIFSKIEDLGAPVTALVIGGANFIGSFLCERLLNLKTKVFCLDFLKKETKENLKNCLLNPNFSFIEQPVDFKDSFRFLRNYQGKIDYIFYLAEIEKFLGKKDLTLDDLIYNSVGIKEYLDLALKHKAKLLYVSSIDVYFLNNPPRFLEEVFSPFFTLDEAKKYAEALINEYYKNYNLDARIARIADVYGPRMNLEGSGKINQFFSALIFNQEIKIPGDGLKKIYPTFVFDAVEGLIRAMFKKDTSGKVFNFIGEEITLIGLASLFKKINPEVRISYIKEESSLEIPLNLNRLLKTAKEINWQTISLEEGVKKTWEYYKGTKKELFLPEKRSKEEIKKEVIPEKNFSEKESGKEKISPKNFFFSFFKKGKNKYIFPIIILLFLLIFSPVFKVIWHGFWGYKNLREIERKKIVKNLDYSIKKASQGERNFSIALKSFDSLSWFFTLIGKKNFQKDYTSLFFIAENLSKAAEHTFLAGKLLSSFFGTVSGEYAGDLFSKTAEARIEIGKAKENLLLSTAGIKGIKNKAFLNEKLNFSSLEKKVTSLKKELDNLDKILTFTPFLLGQDQRKTYLVLLQNNMELRPAGGFIGSFALITFEDGKMIDFKIEDVYTADGQLKGKINPPDEILHYLGQPNWYLRDSNFSPDFPLSAKRAAWFLEKELGFLVDGVIGVDLSFAQKLLGAVGEIEVLDYKEKVNAKNLFAIAEKHSEKDFFPGSTQKKNFLTALGKTLFDKVIYSGEEKYFDLVLAIFESLREKHLFFYFPEEKVQETFLTLGFAGEIKAPAKTKSPGENFDYLMVVDSNFSANKVNYFVNREIKHEVTLGKEYGLLEKVTINYKNNSPTNSWPGGVYKNYLRIIVPEEAIFDTVEILGEEKKPKLIPALTEEEIKNLKPEEFLVIEATESGQRKSWGTLIEVPVGKSKSITFSYKKPFDFNENLALYSLYLQKQAGTKEDKYELIFGYPAFVKVKEKNEGVEKPQLIIFSTKLNTDKEFRVRLEK